MYKLVIVGTVIAYAAATSINHEIVKTVRRTTSLWTTHDPETNPLAGKTLEELKALCGTYMEASNEPENYTSPVEYSALPANFDARTQWGNCVHPIRDQKQCGSCWAFGASEALSDRFCIASKGAVNVILSPEDMVSCDRNDFGCEGGYINKAWDYLTATGVVADSCFPYTAGSGKAPACAAKCTNGAAFKKYKCKSGSVVHPMTP